MGSTRQPLSLKNRWAEWVYGVAMSTALYILALSLDGFSFENNPEQSALINAILVSVYIVGVTTMDTVIESKLEENGVGVAIKDKVIESKLEESGDALLSQIIGESALERGMTDQPSAEESVQSRDCGFVVKRFGKNGAYNAITPVAFVVVCPLLLQWSSVLRGLAPIGKCAASIGAALFFWTIKVAVFHAEAWDKDWKKLNRIQQITPKQKIGEVIVAWLANVLTVGVTWGFDDQLALGVLCSVGGYQLGMGMNLLKESVDSCCLPCPALCGS